MKNIGIICEGPTDYIILSKIIDTITEERNEYVQLQPEPSLTGQYGNGWKGVLKWCIDNAEIKKQLMEEVTPVLDFLVIQLDGDVSRKEKPAHCLCEATVCQYKGVRDPLTCDIKPEDRKNCPIVLPCPNHTASIDGYMDHLKALIAAKLKETSDTCIVIPCDSLDTWIVAAYDSPADVELLENPWENVIARGKSYHGIRIQGKQKRVRLFKEFAPVVSENWSKVTQLCQSARDFEQNILSLTS